MALRNVILNSGIMYVRMAVLMVVNFYITRITMDALGAETYGLLSILTALVALAGFLAGAIETAGQRYISQWLALKKDLGELLSSLFIINLGTALLIALFVVLSGAYYVEHYLNQVILPRDAVVHALYFCLGTFVISLISTPINAYLVASEEFGKYALVHIIEVLVKVTVLLYFMGLGSLDLVLYTQIVFFCILTSRILLIIFFLRRIGLSSLGFKKGLRNLSDLIQFISWNIFGALASILNNHGVSLLVNVFFSLHLSAARAIASQVSLALLQVLNSIQMAFNPRLNKIYVQGSKEELLTLTILNGRMLMLLASTFLMTLTWSVGDYLKLWLGDYPVEAEYFIYFIAVEFYINSVTIPMISLIQASGKIKKYQLAVGGVMLLNIPISYVVLNTYLHANVLYIVPIVLACVTIMMRLYFAKVLVGFNVGEYFRMVVLKSALITLLGLAVKGMFLFVFNGISLFFNLLLTVLMLGLGGIFSASRKERDLVYDMILRSVKRPT